MLLQRTILLTHAELCEQKGLVVVQETISLFFADLWGLGPDLWDHLYFCWLV
jgi:hypothetical protein